MGLTLPEGGRLKLAPLGWEMAQLMEPEVTAFRALLDHLEPYRAVLQWVYQQQIERLLQQDVANFWDQHCSAALGLSDERTRESYVLCFFQLCQAAALGTHINGRKGQPSRLRLDGEELRDYLAEKPKPLRPRPELTLAPAPTGQAQIFISFHEQSGLAAQIAEALDLADLSGRAAERTTTSDEILPAVILRAMRQCAAGVFLLADGDFTNNGLLAAETQITLGAALALYDQRVLLLHEQGLKLPATLQKLAVCTYTDNTLTWASGACLVKTMKEFVAV